MRLFSCHHLAPARVLNTALFQTFPLTVEGDISGDPAASPIHDNRLSEMRHHYYVWTRYHSQETVGFEHYRRLFLITGNDPRRMETAYPDVFRMTQQSALYGTHHFYVSNAVFNQYLDYRESLGEEQCEAITRHLDAFDIVTVRPDFRVMTDMLFFPWEDFGNYVKQTRFFQEAPNLELVVPTQCYWLNCYIMKRPIFDEYMQFAFEALGHFEANMTDPKPAPRFFGHMTERLFTTYLSRKRVLSPHLKILELPTLWYHSDLDAGGDTISHDWRHEIRVAEERGRSEPR